jgi:hypothetical protein
MFTLKGARLVPGDMMINEMDIQGVEERRGEDRICTI